MAGSYLYIILSHLEILKVIGKEQMNYQTWFLCVNLVIEKDIQNITVEDIV